MRYTLEILLPILPPLHFGSFEESWQNTIRLAEDIIKVAKKEVAALEQREEIGSYQILLRSVRLKEFETDKARRSFTSKINRVSHLDKHTSIISNLAVSFNLELETDAKGIEFNETVSGRKSKRAKLDGEEYVKYLSDAIFCICMPKIEAIYIISHLARPNGVTFGSAMLQLNEAPLSAYTFCKNPFRSASIELGLYGVPNVPNLTLTGAW